MAERLESYTFGKSRDRYDWDSWLDGNIWRLTRGVDFHCKVLSMRSLVYQAANARRVAVRTSVDGDILVMQKVDADEV